MFLKKFLFPPKMFLNVLEFDIQLFVWTLIPVDCYIGHVLFTCMSNSLVLFTAYVQWSCSIYSVCPVALFCLQRMSSGLVLFTAYVQWPCYRGPELSSCHLWDTNHRDTAEEVRVTSHISVTFYPNVVSCYMCFVITFGLAFFIYSTKLIRKSIYIYISEQNKYVEIFTNMSDIRYAIFLRFC